MRIFFTIFLTTLFLSSQAQVFDWVEQNSTVNVQLSDVFFIDNQSGWAVGDGGSIVATDDGGDNWNTQASGQSEPLRAVFFANDTVGWIAGGQGTPLLLSTVNGGTNWVDISPNIAASQINDVFFSDASHGWIISMDSVYYTEDGANSWSHQPFSASSSSGTTLNALCATSDTTAFIGGKYNQGGFNARPTIFDNQTNPMGLWTAAAAPSFDADDVIRSLSFTDPLTGFAGGQKGKLYKMESDGINFSGPWELNFNSGSNSIIRKVDFPSSQNGMFNTSIQVGTQTVSLIYQTDDGGDNWSIPDSIFGLLQATISYPDNEHAWIVGDNGKIYKGEASVINAVNNIVLSHLDVYPNPFTTQLVVILPETLNLPQVKLTNSSGQLISGYHINSAGNRIELSGLDKLTPGIYNLLIQNEHQKVSAAGIIIRN